MVADAQVRVRDLAHEVAIAVGDALVFVDQAVALPRAELARHPRANAGELVGPPLFGANLVVPCVHDSDRVVAKEDKGAHVGLEWRVSIKNKGCEHRFRRREPRAAGAGRLPVFVRHQRRLEPFGPFKARKNEGRCRQHQRHGETAEPPAAPKLVVPIREANEGGGLREQAVVEEAELRAEEGKGLPTSGHMCTAAMRQHSGGPVIHDR
mmetsp:Transcript_11411/g.35236  ORF Transcript_11411/g.35236 Transcript_11411/m.35236 type:complete len:209 (+) Transcript_11411:989-1615(+)